MSTNKNQALSGRSALSVTENPPSSAKNLGGFFYALWSPGKPPRQEIRMLRLIVHDPIEAGKNLFRTENAMLFGEGTVELSQQRQGTYLPRELLAYGLQQPDSLGRISIENPGNVFTLTTWAETHAEAGDARQGGMRMGSSSHRPTDRHTDVAGIHDASDASEACLAMLA